jgi:Na+(H+)/acetate symporter ActP
LVFTAGVGAVGVGALATGLAMVTGLAGAPALVAGALVSFDLQAVMMKKKMKAK